jgi:hypothetical protein
MHGNFTREKQIQTSQFGRMKKKLQALFFLTPAMLAIQPSRITKRLNVIYFVSQVM